VEVTIKIKTSFGSYLGLVVLDKLKNPTYKIRERTIFFAHLKLE